MAEERVQRRLAAILVADVVGYSRLMGEDEEGTLSRLKTLRRELFHPKTKQYGGRIFKTTGDGAFVEFNSAVEAVKSASDIQKAIAERNAEVSEDQKILLRIGISLGDVIVEGSDLYGNGVNVASRMEGLAEPGGICVSGNVHEHIGRSLDVNFEDLGEQTVKNIDRPIRCYRVHLERGGASESLPALSTKPAVAVLPFENMSGDPEQEYFADGLTEDIITALSLWRAFPVIARNSTFAYKGQSSDIRKVGEELGARYVVEGSVRKAGNRVRITAQLINAETGHHVWAERYDRELEDIFDLQDEITHHIAAIIEPEVERSEQQRVTAKSPNDLAAWEYCLRGYAHIEEHTKEANEMARQMFARAIDLDANYARAHTGLSFTYARDLRFWPPEHQEEWERLFSETARRAVALDAADSEARTMLARVYLRVHDFDAAITEARRAVELNPHSAYANNILGDLLAYSGRFEEGIPWMERARQLNPMDPRAYLISNHFALAHLGAGDYEKAVEFARDAIRRKPDFIEPYILLASAFGYLDRPDEAGKAIKPFGEAVSKFFERERMWAPVTRNRVLDGLHKAGLPE